jgi:CheY-like chemotaxis protein
MLQRLIGEEVRLSWVPEAGLWPVKLDPSQVSMVLANLCVNSRDAIEGMGCITIESRNETVDEADCAKYPDAVAGDYVTLVVSDDGCGMAPEVLAHVFDPFFTTKDVDKGTGLGLATVHGIALQNGGFVDISSEPGQGTVLRVHFPRHRSAPPAPKHVEPRAAVEGGGETVLVVEDEPALLRMCGETLRRLGYRVLLAGLPGEAVELADRPGERIDLLITDVVMPHMSGPALAARLSARHSDLVCLYMSGYSEDVISQHGIVEEGLNFIPKPFPRKALAEKVRQALVRE